MPIEADVLKYAIVPPYIDVSKMLDADRDGILGLAPKVWHFLQENVGFLYFPVMTIFADESAYRFMVKVVSHHGCKFGMQNNYLDCESAWKIIEAVFTPSILTDMRLSDESERIARDHEDNPCAYKLEFLEMVARFLSFKRDGSDWGPIILRTIISMAREMGNAGGLVLRFLEKYTSGSDLDRVLQLIRAIITHCFSYTHLPGIGPTIKGVRDDLFRLHGCYVSPELVTFLKEKGTFEEIMRQHGLRGDVHLVSDAFIFIYPTVLHQSFDAFINRFSARFTPADSAGCFYEFVNHTVVHEHTHALHRHGITKVYFIQKKLDFITDVAKLSQARWKYQWIEEGFAEESTFLYYHLKVFPGDEKNPIRQFLLRTMDAHSDAIMDREVWPYHGRRDVERFLGITMRASPAGVISYDIPADVYSGKKKKFYTCIGDWKKDPERLSSKLR